MDTSPVYPNYKTNGEECYDPQLDFAQFLKEAKTHAAYHHKCAASSLHVQQMDVTTKPKKSWKTSNFTWLKADKKSSNKTNIIKEHIQPLALESLCIKSKTRHGYVSGPVNGIKSCTVHRPKRTTSGPLSGLFNQRKRTEEYQMPYISLGQFNSTRDVRSYGPVYLVT